MRLTVERDGNRSGGAGAAHQLMHDPQRAPLRVRAAQLADHRLQLRRGPMRTRHRPMRPIDQARQPRRAIAPRPTHAPTGATPRSRRATSLTRAPSNTAITALIPLLDDRQRHQCQSRPPRCEQRNRTADHGRCQASTEAPAVKHQPGQDSGDQGGHRDQLLHDVELLAGDFGSEGEPLHTRAARPRVCFTPWGLKIPASGDPGPVGGRWGAVVNNASIAGTSGIGGLTAYVAAKHGDVGFTRATALAHAGDGIRVNALVTGTSTLRCTASYSASGPTRPRFALRAQPHRAGGRPGGSPRSCAAERAMRCERAG